MKKILLRYNEQLKGNATSFHEDITWLCGNVTLILGDVTWIPVTWITGDVDTAELTEKEKEKGINIEDLIKY